MDGSPATRQVGIDRRNAGRSAAGESVVATLTPGSVLLAQAGATATDAATGGWQFTIAPYLWAPRTDIDLTVGPLTRSTTIDFFSDVVDNLNLGFTGHFEANWREWTGLLDLLYLKLGKDESPNGVPTELDFQLLFFEFGGTYRLATLPVGRTGRITLEALAGGRLMYVDAELTIGGQSRSRSTTLIDPMFGGRIAYHITDTVALWFRGDVAGFGISDSQSELTYNLIAGLNWRFTPWHPRSWDGATCTSTSRKAPACARSTRTCRSTGHSLASTSISDGHEPRASGVSPAGDTRVTVRKPPPTRKEP